MKNIAYYNGKTAPIEEMMVPMNDRACYFGDGVYDATCVVNHVPMAFDDHIDRIYRSAKLIDIEIPMEKAEMKRMLQGLVDQVEGDVLFLYWQVTRGVGMRNHPYAGAGDKPSIWAFVRPSKMRDPFGVYKCITVEDKRFFYCNIKTINLLPAVMANEKAMQAGCDEAIFHRGERVTECSHSNVHIIKDGTLYTAPCDELILPGITRAHILNICKQEGIPVVEEPFTLDEMMDADEIFFSSSSALTCRIGEIALVPASSPINQSGVLFYNTLFDENAACHIAFGAGYPTNIKGGRKMNRTELLAKGLNDSAIHEDVMIGAPDTNVIGTTKDGKEVTIFTNGEWAF